MVRVPESVSILSENRREKPLRDPGCQGFELQLQNYLVDLEINRGDLGAKWFLVSTGISYTRPTAVVFGFYKPSTFGVSNALITYCHQDPALEGQIVMEYTKEKTAYKWPRPKRPMFTPLEFPQNYAHKHRVLTVDNTVRMLGNLGCAVGPHFRNNILAFSSWLYNNRPDDVVDIFSFYQMQ